MTKPIRSALLLAAFLLLSQKEAAAQSNNNNNNNFVLNLLHVNDHHSNLEEQTFLIPKWQLPDIDRDAFRRVSYGGYPRLINLFRKAKQTLPNVLKLHAGDAITGSGFYRLFGNQPDVDMMHQVCFDAVNLGNHEFDDGDAQLADFLQKLTNEECVVLHCVVVCEYLC